MPRYDQSRNWQALEKTVYLSGATKNPDQSANSVTAKPKKSQPDRLKPFVQAARALGCDESEQTFDKTLRKIEKPKPGTSAKK